MKNSHDSIENEQVDEKSHLKMVRGTEQFSKEDTQVANRDIQRSSTLLITNTLAGVLTRPRRQHPRHVHSQHL